MPFASITLSNDSIKINVVEKSPAKKDLVKPLVNELQKNRLKVGLYYSLLDWSHPDYPNKTKVERRYENDSTRWDRFVGLWVVGNGTKLNWDIKMKQYWSSVPGIVHIYVPENVLDKHVTVIAVLLEGKVDLYREKGQVITSN